MSNITIYEIAREAGCSASTVSRVINGYPYVKKTTREKVRQIIERENYVPNETARNLVTQSTHLVGILLSDIRTTQHTDGIYWIEKELSKRGYSSIICNTGSSVEGITQYLEMLSQRNAEAVILMGSIYQNEETEKALSLYLPSVPVILCNGVLGKDNIHSILCDEKNGVCGLVKLLFERGSRHIVFAYDNPTPSNRRKHEGFLEGIRETSGISEDNSLRVSGSIEEMYETLKDFLMKNGETDAIIFSEDFLASVALTLLEDLGISVPDRIQIAGINNSRFARLSVPSLTSLDNRLYDISMTAAETVLTLLGGGEAPEKVIIPPEIVERKSTRRK